MKILSIKAAWLVVVLIAASIAGFIWLTSSPDTRPVKATPMPSLARGSSFEPTQREAPPQAAAAVAWGARDAGALRATRTNYETAVDLRSVFEAGLRTPEDGGLYYARRVQLDCSALAAAVRSWSDGALPTSVDQQRKRCSGVGDVASAQRLSGTLKTAVSDKDPLYAIVNAAQNDSLRGTFGIDAIKSSLNAAIELGDPYVLQAILNRTVLIAATFDGERIDFVLQQSLVTANAIATCALGAECSGGNVAISCLWFDKCEHSQVDVVLNNPVQSETDRAKIFKLADRIAGAARDGTLPSLFAGVRAS